jgi:hypothetical protein
MLTTWFLSLKLGVQAHGLGQQSKDKTSQMICLTQEH